MKKKILLFTLTAFVSSMPMHAQKAKNTKAEDGQIIKNAYKTTFEKNSFGSNWYFSLGGGAQILQATDDNKAYFKDRITFAPTLSIAKYFSPLWGLRVQFSGGTLHGFNDGQDGTYTKWNSGSRNYMGGGYAGTEGYPENIGPSFLTWDPQWNYMGYSLNNPDPHKAIVYNPNDGTYRWLGHDLGELYMQKVNYFSANLNFMFNLITLLGSYNPRRIFELTPFGGIGYYHSFPNLGARVYDAPGVNAGIMAKIRFSKRLSFYMEGNAIMVPNGFDGQVGGRKTFEAVTQVTGGFSLNIGKTTWSICEPMNYEMIDNLNQQINDLKIQLTKPRPESPPVPKVVVEPPKAIKFLPDPVFFRIDKAIIDAPEFAKIQKAADYLKNNPETNVIVTGYADKQTAYPQYNLKLSERRAKAVAQELISKYNITPLRVSVNWSGDKIQPFKNNDWNRVVIFVLDKQK